MYFMFVIPNFLSFANPYLWNTYGTIGSDSPWYANIGTSLILATWLSSIGGQYPERAIRLPIFSYKENIVW